MHRREDITTIPCNPVPISNGRRNCSVSVVEVQGTIPLAPGSIASSGAPVSGAMNAAAPAPQLLASNSAAPAPAGSALADRSLASVFPPAKESNNHLWVLQPQKGLMQIVLRVRKQWWLQPSITSWLYLLRHPELCKMIASCQPLWL